ncbi:CPBP family intramembrane glutamic endopeptidase [Clostridium botulinum]|uniref:CPBP family intramembrane glutamic endopeptidase n=1 Tax=Clostridium botulinum TaxID=1491 RepID=UPI000AE66A48|nr:type II CAAX endopeptidase family protein [Clostridium botulinum]
MKKSIVYTGLYIFIGFIAPRILNTFIASTNTILYNIILYTILAVLAFVLFRKELYEDFREFLLHPWKIIGITLLTFCLIMLCSTIFIIIPGTNQLTQNQDLVNKFLSTSIVPIFIVVIVGPFVEEIIFRHILIGKLQNKIPQWILCTLSILTFGIIHIHTFTLAGILEIKQYIIIGTAMTILYTKNKNNLSYPVAAHIFNNLIATILSLASQLH